MSVERLWFQNAVEGLFIRNLSSQLNDENRRALAAAGLKLDKLLPAYPVSVMKAALQVVGPVVLPKGTWAEQQRDLGNRLVKGYFDTVLGAALSSLLRLVGPDRGLSRLDRSLRSITNYLDCRVENRAPQQVEVVVEPVDGLSWFLLGIFEGSGGLLFTKGGTSTIELLNETAEQCRLRITWKT